MPFAMLEPVTLPGGRRDRKERWIRMSQPRALVLRAPGTNCDEETAAAWSAAGADVETWHVGRILEDPTALDRFGVLTIPGGFSYGDDLGAGRILATRLAVLGEAIGRF